MNIDVKQVVSALATGFGGLSQVTANTLGVALAGIPHDCVSCSGL